MFKAQFLLPTYKNNRVLNSVFQLNHSKCDTFPFLLNGCIYLNQPITQLAKMKPPDTL